MALSTAQTRRAWSRYKCNRKGWLEITFLGRFPCRTIDVLRDAWAAAEQALKATGYIKADIVGSYNCRAVRDSTHTLASLHAYRLAFDVDPAKNVRKRYGTTRRKWWEWSKITRTQVDAVLAIRTNNGKRVFTHGGTFRSQDPMHFQVACTPADIKTGIRWDTVKGHHSHQAAPQSHRTGSKPSHPTIRKGASGDAVKELQRRLAVGLAVDGAFGNRTHTALRAFQRSAHLTVDGICGPKTWAALDQKGTR